MHHRDSQISAFPPLTVAPDWAATKALDSDALQAIRRQAWALAHRLDAVAAMIGTVPGPPRELLKGIPSSAHHRRIEGIRAELQELAYPTRLTAWVNTARTTAARAAALYAECHGILQQLCELSPAEDAYRDGLALLRRHIAQVASLIHALVAQIDEQASPPPHGLAEQPAGDAAPTGRSAEWHSGWHSGVREAEALLRDLLHPHNTLIAQGERPIAQEIVERVLACLSARMHAAGGGS